MKIAQIRFPDGSIYQFDKNNKRRVKDEKYKKVAE